MAIFNKVVATFSRFRQRRSTGGSAYSSRYNRPRGGGDLSAWTDIGQSSDRLHQSSRVLRAKDYLRRQFDLYAPPAAIFKGVKNDRFNWPTFRPAYHWNFPAFGRQYGEPYKRYSPVAYPPIW